MSYLIYKSDGTPITVPDNTIDTAFYNSIGGGGIGGAGNGQGVQLLGRNTINYGAAIAQNILQSAENFCSANFPIDSTALQGQLWFNQISAATGSLYVRVSNATSGGIANWQQIATTSNINTSLPTATTTQLYGGSGLAGVSNIVTIGAGLSLVGGTLIASGSGGTVTSVSVVTANGFTGTVATASSTPAITLATSVTGLLKGDGTAISAAVLGTDYAAPGVTNTYTSSQIFTGSTTSPGMIVTNAEEVVDLISTAPAAVQTFYVASGSLQYYTPNAANNWTVNFGWSATTTMNSVLGTGNSITVAMLVTQGGTAFFANAFQVDGVAVTPQWQGNITPSAGNANGTDIYTFTIIKTAASTYKVFGALTQYK
jgi:hypothetical protein